MNPIKRAAGAALLGLLLVVLGACGSGGQEASVSESPPTTMSLQDLCVENTYDMVLQFGSSGGDLAAVGYSKYEKLNPLTQFLKTNYALYNTERMADPSHVSEWEWKRIISFCATGEYAAWGAPGQAQYE